MIAMHYRFPLPADYDMEIIRTRIREKGHLLDGFQHLVFKAYLYAARDELGPDTVNAYAPFYLWESHFGMRAFLEGPGFGGLVASFGRPEVRSWNVTGLDQDARFRDAAFASLQIDPIRPHRRLPEHIADAEVWVKERRSAGSLLSLAGYDPAHWDRICIHFTNTPPALANDLVYRVGYWTK